jgi:predicted small lipoprotein YifL
MIRRIIFILILSYTLTACGGAAPAATQAPVVTEAPAATEAPAEPLVIELSPTLEPTQTFTPEPTYTPSVTPTETPLPPLELPTEAVNAPARMVWDGTPTYLGDSTPGYAFRVTYDPDLWAVTSDQFGFPALGHRKIEYCVIAVTSGRGLPANISIEHDVLYTDGVTFDVGVASENGLKKFVTYTGGDGKIITGFEVTFQDQVESCLADAVTVLSTLKSVPVSQATPQP